MLGIHKLNEVMHDKMLLLYKRKKYHLTIEVAKSLLEKARRLEDKISEGKALEILIFANYYEANYVQVMLYMKDLFSNKSKALSPEKWLDIYLIATELYLRQNMSDKAKKYLEKADHLVLDQAIYSGEIKVQKGYGQYYNHKGEYDRAITYFEKALRIGEQYHFTDIVPSILGQLGRAYLKIGRLSRGKKVCDQAIIQLKATSKGMDQVVAYMYRGEADILEGNEQAGVNQVKVAMVIAKKKGYLQELIECTQILAAAYSRINEYKQAYITLKDLAPLKQSLCQMLQEMAFIQIQSKEVAGKEATMSDLLKEQNAVLEEKNKHIQQQARELERLNQVLGQQNDDLHQSATEDYLTGVYNRKYFTMRMQEEFEHAKKTKDKLACIIFDIDKFKNINDTYGHLIGDEVIKHISGLCEESLDTDSIIGRFGGDEFMILMIGADIDEAEEKANELIEVLALEPLIIEKKLVTATLSLGVSDNYFANPQTADEMINNADNGLYRAKKEGRNRCNRME